MSKIKAMEETERPREKAIINGIQTLSDSELLAILLRSGVKDVSAIDLGKQILKKVDGLYHLTSLTLEDLIHMKGIKQTKALQLLACFELSRRISYEKAKTKFSIERPDDLIVWLNQEIGQLPQEHFLVLFLDQRNQISSYETLFIGTLNASVVHPREIFKEALRRGCASIICVHNHPSGNCEPSQADIEITQCLFETGKLVGIPMLDHLIVGGNNYVSLRQKLLLD